METLLGISQTINPILARGLSAEDFVRLTIKPEVSSTEPRDNSSATLGKRIPAANPPVFRGAAEVSKGTGAIKGKRRSRNRSRILVVDDIADVTEMIGLFLKHAGYEVATADSARAALQLARSKKFDMIISDIGMPQMNGYELAEELRTMPKYKQIPIIAVTGYTEYDDRGRAVEAGFNTHLSKPIDPAGLLKLIEDLLN